MFAKSSLFNDAFIFENFFKKIKITIYEKDYFSMLSGIEIPLQPWQEDIILRIEKTWVISRIQHESLHYLILNLESYLKLTKIDYLNDMDVFKLLILRIEKENFSHYYDLLKDVLPDNQFSEKQTEMMSVLLEKERHIFKNISFKLQEWKQEKMPRRDESVSSISFLKNQTQNKHTHFSDTSEDIAPIYKK